MEIKVIKGDKKAQEMARISGAERKKYVKNMFNGIARRYDLLNHLLSGGVDIYWRKRAVTKLNPKKGERILDLACGTGDFAIESRRRADCTVFGADIAVEMLRLGKRKTAEISQISFINADGEQLSVKSGSIDGVTIAFGIRNMGSIIDALREMNRVLIPSKGRAVILEFSKPASPLLKAVYLFYFNKILPVIGRLISSDADAYRYLPESVDNFPEVENFVKMMEKAGFDNVRYWKLFNGIAVIYRGEKRG
jgi:demethylmenaquinone methyltransferase/2-methoxy-6-polyprenyl-1,4-benzoquinol methylase